MSDFQPPQFQPPQPPPPPPAPPSFAAPGPSGPPTTPIEVAASPKGKKRSTGIIIGAAVAVIALIGAGAFALTKIGGDDEGGAASPTEAGEQFVQALNDEDVLGAVDLLLPGERKTFRQPMIDLVDNLKRLDVLGDDADPSKVKGVDINLTGVSVTADAPAAKDITTIQVNATDESTVDGEQLPLGDIIVDEALGGERPTETSEPSGSEQELRITTVEKDGRWYVSLFYSIAEQARLEAGGDAVPEQGVPLVGADEPQDAVDQMITALTELDLTAMIGGLNPNEAEALQRYAPLFLDEADQETSDLDIEISFADPTYEVTGSGSHRHVTLTAFTLTAAGDGDELTITAKDGCVTIAAADETFDSCENGGDITKSLEDAGFGEDMTPEVRDLIDTVKDAFDGFSIEGVAVDEVDGEWYVSPLGTWFDVVNGALGALDAQELQDIIDAAKQVDAGSIDLPRQAPKPFTPDTLPTTSDTVPDTVDTVPDTTDDTAGETLPDDEAPTAEDFRSETVAFIESQKLTDEVGFALHDAECDLPTSTDVGTHYSCWGTDEKAQRFVLDVQITEVDGFTIEHLEPA